MHFVSSHWRSTKNGDPYYLANAPLSAKPFNQAHFQKLFCNVMKYNNYAQSQQFEMWNIKTNNDILIVFKGKRHGLNKFYEKWRSLLFGATCNFNDQILPYGILFSTFISTNVFYLL
jgi:hypothetical protein